MYGKQLINPQWKEIRDNDDIIEISIESDSTKTYLQFKINVIDIQEDEESMKLFRETLRTITQTKNEYLLPIYDVVEYENEHGYYFEVSCELPQQKTVFDYHEENMCLQAEVGFCIKNIIEIYKLVCSLDSVVCLSLNDISLVNIDNPLYPFPQIVITPFAFIRGLIDVVEETPTFKHKPFVPILQFFCERITENQIQDEIKQLVSIEKYFTFPKQIIAKEKSTVLDDIIERMNDEKDSRELIEKNDYLSSITKSLQLKQFDLDNVIVEKNIGKGFTGLVAQVTIDKKIYAMKQTEDSFTDALHKESFVLSQLHHPNIIHYEGYMNDKRNILQVEEKASNVNNCYGYMLLEYCHYETLHDYIKNELCSNYPIPLQTIKILIGQLFASVFYIHDQRIVHRDLKPTNYLIKQLEPFVWIKLCDCGSSRTNDTIMTSVIGTFITCSPDIILGKGYTDRIELFSLGCCIYYILFGKYPANDCHRLNDIITVMNQQKVDYNFKARFNEWIEKEHPEKKIIDEYLCLVSFVQQILEMTSSTDNLQFMKSEDYWNHFKSSVIVINCLNETCNVFQSVFPNGF